MTSTLTDILGPDGAIARRLGDRYEHRPQQLEMAEAVASAFAEGHHLLVEAGTGVGKSFAYLLPAIDFAVKNKKRVVISTHTISLQEQLIDKDIPLIQSVYPNEFSAVLVKGRSNYLCQRRLEQTRGRQNFLFDHDKQLESLWAIEDWAAHTTDGSLADLPAVPDRDVWDKVAAEHGNCLNKKCKFYEHCFWQAAKRRMQSGNILVVNHALFFSDLALRMAGVNYLPKYDLCILDEAHTVEDVAGDHFGLKISEGGLRYSLRHLYDLKRGKGLLSTHGSMANPAIRAIVDLYEIMEGFFERCIHWHEEHGRGNGRIHEPNWVENDLSPKLRDLHKHLKEMLAKLENEEEISELSSQANRVAMHADALDAILGHKLQDAVYWLEVSGRTPKKVSLHAAPIDVAAGLRTQLFEKLHSVVLTSATLCAAASGTPKRTTRKKRGTGASPVQSNSIPNQDQVQKRRGAYLPHWTKNNGVYAVTFRLNDSLPEAVLDDYRDQRDELLARLQNQTPTEDQTSLDELHREIIDEALDAGHGECVLRLPDCAKLLADTIAKFDGQKYHAAAWCIMPNHVHAVLQPLPGNELPEIIHSIKSWTAKAINKLLGREGALWQVEYYDHLVRDENDLANQIAYTFSNSDRAGMSGWQWRFRSDEIAQGIAEGEKGEDQHGRGARATDQVGESTNPAFAYIKSRLGIIREKTLQLGSPFNYEEQATLYIEEDLPEPGDANRFPPRRVREDRQISPDDQRRRVRPLHQLQNAR